MPILLDEFFDQLFDSGLMSAAEIDVFQQSLPKTTTSKDLAAALVNAGKLTKFQAQLIYSGKSDHLFFGNYLLIDRIGEGGMGKVYLAEHRRMERRVALKVLPSAFAKDNDAVERFYQEIKAAARLSHPNIVTAHDADEAHGMHFLVMEYVDGDDLASVVLEHGPLPIDDAVSCILQASRGLEYLHARQLIHRDIKPANLLLDTEGTVRIADMGLARFEHAGKSGLTKTGNIIGTLEYMSPEQALDTKQTDSRTDIYSLGCTLHFLLTGRPVYHADTYAQQLLAHQTRPIPSLLVFCPDAPADLDFVFQKMVAKRREDRYQNIAEVIEALGFSVSPELTEFPAVASQDDLIQRDTRETSSALTRRESPKKSSSLKATIFDKLGRLKELALASPRNLYVAIGLLAGFPILIVVVALLMSAGPQVDDDEPADAESGIEKPVAVVPRQTPTATDTTVKRPAPAIPRQEPTVADHLKRGNLLRSMGDHGKAIVEFTEAIRLDPKNASAYTYRGNAWTEKRIPNTQNAIADFSKAIRLDPKSAAVPFFNRGQAWLAMGQYENAIQDYTDAVRLNPNDASAYANRGVAWFVTREHDKAIQDYSEAIRLDPKSAALTYVNRGQAWAAKRVPNRDRAIYDYTEAIRLDPNNAKAYRFRGVAWLNKREWDIAIKDFTEAIRLDSNNALAYSGRAIAYRSVDLDAAAAADERKAKELGAR